VDGVPSLLTVEEAARVLRVGRTKAYAMAREWRATEGRSGLPVIEFGHLLRVPLCQLEALVGGPLIAEGTIADTPATAVEVKAPPTARSSTTGEQEPPDPEPANTSSRAPRRRTRTPDQPTLPFAD
jgi:hypothetical protein